MTCNTKIGGVWRDISDSFVKVNGTWRNVNKTYIKVDGVWRDACKNKSKGLFGVRINTTDSNPDSAVTYIEDAIGFTPARGNNGSFTYGSWADKFPFNEIKPCVLKNGVVQYYLNPNDYTKKEDGTNADITTGNDGDVMIEFPKIYWKFEKSGNYIFIRYSGHKIDNSYVALAHTKNGIEKDNIYISAYHGHELSSKLRSLSSKQITVNKNISSARIIANANGSGYGQMSYYQLLMTQILYLVMFKSRDSQTALGKGLTSYSTRLNTGGTNNKGLFFGDSNGSNQMKFCGLEDWYGNVRYWIDGIFIDNNFNALISDGNFNDTGSGYINLGQVVATGSYGTLQDVQGGSQTGFLVKSVTSDTSTYYCDRSAVYAGCVSIFGGDWSNGVQAGAFSLISNISTGSTYSYVGSRLTYW